MQNFLPIIFSLVLVLQGYKIEVQTHSLSETLNFVEERMKNSLEEIPNRGKFPRSIEGAKTAYVGVYDWTSGFYPGSLWYLYKLTGIESWKVQAEKMSEFLTPLQHYKKDHDIGFQLNCSFGNGYKFSNNETYKEVIINGAESLITRYDSIVGSIKSWDWSGKTKDGYQFNFPVIIDNMMNLELLFLASKLSGNSKYREVAISHARTTMKNHFRPDYSSYHLVNYDSITGEVLGKYTYQGYSHESSWARGQAWALYGFTLCAKETGQEEFLHHAELIAKYIMEHPNMPEDKVPMWDYHAGVVGFEPSWSQLLPKKLDWKDASAAAITSSALLDLGSLTGKKKFIDFATEIFNNLNADYRSDNKSFILGKSVGNLPKNSEIDVPLNYADYYFLETLVKLNK